jgi:SAM-dependent methyltransferase
MYDWKNTSARVTMQNLTNCPYTADELQNIYARRFQGHTEYRQSVWRILTQEFFSRYITAGGAVLDLGCVHCEFINQSVEGKRYAMDLNPQAKQTARPDVRVLLQDCSTEWALGDEKLDVVFTSNFFEHLPTKHHLERTLRQAFRCLRRGGRLIALGPNIRYLPGAYWDFFDHYISLTDRSLSEVLEKVGFRIEKRLDRFLPYSMSQGSTPPLWMIRLYLRLPLIWKWKGKQFLLVAVKPEI